MAKDFHLKFPQWKNGNWIIGLGSYLFKNTNIIHVYCDYRKKNGTKLWDSFLICTHEFAKKFPLAPLQKDPRIKLYRIPYQELLTFHDRQTEKQTASKPFFERKKEEHKENKRLANKKEIQYIVHMNQQKHKWNAFEFARSLANEPNAPIYILPGKDRYLCAGTVIEPYVK